MKKVLLWGGGILLALIVLGVMVGGDESTTTSSAPETASAPAANDPGISAAEFGELKTGMSYSEAVAIIGGEGELMSENEMAGTRTVMYQWDGESGFGANANAMFQNDKLVQKAQFGLK